MKGKGVIGRDGIKMEEEKVKVVFVVATTSHKN